MNDLPQGFSKKKMSTWELAKTLPVPDIENTNKNSIFQKAGSSPFSLTKASQKENETGTSYGDIRSGNEKDSTSSQSTGIKKESVNDLAGSTFQKAKYFSDTDEGREAEDCLSVNTGNIAKAQRVVDNDKKVLPPTARKVPTFGASKSSVPKLAPKFSCRPFTKKSVSSVNSGTKTGPNQNEKKSKTDSLSLTPVSSSSLRDDQARSTQSNFVADTKNSVEAFKPSFSVTDTLKSANDPKHSEVKTSLGIKNSTKQSGGEKENAPSSSKKENKITAKNLDTNQDLSKNVIDKGDAQFDHSQNGNDDMKTSFAKRQETSHLEVDKVISDGEKENVTSNITVDIEKIDPSPMAVEANDDREYRSTSPQAELEAQKPISMSPSEPFNNDKDKMSKACKKHPLKSSKVTDIAKTFTSEDSHMDWNDFFSLVINNVMEEKDHKEKSKLTPSRKKNRNYRAATEPKGEMSSLVDKDSLKAKITKKRKSSVGDKVTDKRETTHISGRANFDRLPKKRSSSEPASTHRENKRQRSVSAYEPLQGNKKEVDAISSPSTLAHKEKIRDMLQKNFDNWVQCDQCKKWRKLLPSIDPPALPSKWKCELNENREENACSVPEADWNKENVYVFDSFIPGSVVWARVVGTAWCPALVDIDPDFLVATWLDDAMRNVAYYHVTFFGEPVSRAWVTASNIVEFRETDTHKRFFSRGLKERYNADELKVAVHQARLALKLSLTARKKKYSFVARFKGKFGSVFKGKKQRTDEFTQQKLEAEKRHYRRIKTDFGLFDSQVSSDEGTINEDISAAITKKETQDEEISNPDNCKALESEGQGNIRMPSENKIAKYSENEDEALRENERDFCHVLGNQTDSLYHKEISTAVETCAKARKQKTATTLSIIDDKISQEVCIEGHGLGNPEKSSEIMETLENPPHDNTQDQLSSEDLPSLVDIRKNTTDMTKNFVDDTSKKRNDNKTTCMSDAGACSKEIRSNIMGGYEDESEGGDMEVHENKDKGICSTSGNTDKGICATSGNTDKGICAKAGMRTDRNKVEGTFRRDVALFPGTASTWHSCKDGRHCMISKPIKRELVKNVNSLDDVNKKNELFDEFPSTQGDLKENIAGIIKQLENETDKNDYGEGNVDCLGAEHISKGSKTVFVQKHDTRISQDDKLGRKIYTKSDLQSNILQQNEMEYVGTNDLSMVPDSQESVNSCEDFSKKHNLIPSHLNKASLGKSLIVDQESEEIQLQYNHLH